MENTRAGHGCDLFLFKNIPKSLRSQKYEHCEMSETGPNQMKRVLQIISQFRKTAGTSDAAKKPAHASGDNVNTNVQKAIASSSSSSCGKPRLGDFRFFFVRRHIENTYSPLIYFTIMESLVTLRVLLQGMFKTQ